MANLKNGILGSVSGKIGNVVGANWKGIDYIRIKPSSVANPNTPLQANQRLKFSALQKFLQPMNDYVRVGFKAYAVKMSAFNAAFSFNYHHALEGSFPHFGIDYAKAVLSRGNLPGVNQATLASDNEAKVLVTWVSSSINDPVQESDSVLIAIFEPESHHAVFMQNAGTRVDGQAEIAVPFEFRGKTVHAYLSFNASIATQRTGAKNAVSNSFYAGSVVVA